MIFDVGHLILITALLIAVFGVAVAFWGGYTRNSKLVASSFNAIYAVFALVFAASLILWYGLLGDHFELSYVWNHSEIALPTFYKFAALWGGNRAACFSGRCSLQALAWQWRCRIATSTRC